MCAIDIRSYLYCECSGIFHGSEMRLSWLDAVPAPFYSPFIACPETICRLGCKRRISGKAAHWPSAEQMPRNRCHTRTSLYFFFHHLLVQFCARLVIVAQSCKRSPFKWAPQLPKSGEQLPGTL